MELNLICTIVFVNILIVCTIIFSYFAVKLISLMNRISYLFNRFLAILDPMDFDFIMNYMSIRNMNDKND